MKKDYRKPLIEVVEIELEGIICSSGTGDSSSGNEDVSGTTASGSGGTKSLTYISAW